MIYCYHHDDLDGICSGSIVDRAFPTESKKFISTTYPIDKDKILSTVKNVAGLTNIFFVDLSFGGNDKNFLVELSNVCAARNIEITWIDHHEKSKLLIENWEDIPKSIFHRISISECGACGAYYYFHGEECRYPMFLSLVDTWDRHLTTASNWINSIRFQFAMMSSEDLTPQSPVFEDLLTGGGPVIQYICDRGDIIWKYFKENSRRLIESDGVITDVEGVECLSLNYHGSSMVFDDVRNDFPLVMQWHYDGHLYHYSVYAGNENIDCNAIASRYGGGGHIGAAGFSSDRLLFLPDKAIKYNK